LACPAWEDATDTYGAATGRLAAFVALSAVKSDDQSAKRIHVCKPMLMTTPAHRYVDAAFIAEITPATTKRSEAKPQRKLVGSSDELREAHGPSCEPRHTTRLKRLLETLHTCSVAPN
jgi:hypothetical protein